MNVLRKKMDKEIGVLKTQKIQMIARIGRSSIPFF